MTGALGEDLVARFLDPVRPFLQPTGGTYPSVKLAAGFVIPGRRLRLVDRGHGPGAADADPLFEALGVPVASRGLAASWWERADRALVGIEDGPEGAVAKLYFEEPVIDPPAGLGRPGPTVHVALKWPVHGTGPVRTTWYLGRKPTGLGRLLDQVQLRSVAGRPLAQLLDAIGGLWEHQMTGRGQPVLEVIEEGSRRRSVDVLVVDAGLSVADLSNLLPSFISLAPSSAILETLGPIGAHGLARLAGGSDLRGRPFLTVFHRPPS